MSNIHDLAIAAIEGVVRILPAILAAYYAYRLWIYKAGRERADEIIKGALMLKYFSSALERSLLSDPRGSGLVSIEALNSHLSSVLITQTLSEQFAVATDTYFRWKAIEYFPLDQGNRDDIEARRVELIRCQSACNQVMSVVRSLSTKALSTQNFSSL